MLKIDQDLKHRVALVTGSGQRIGACFNRYLHAAGASVVIHYKSSVTEAKALQTELNAQRANSAVIIQADLADEDSYASLIDCAISTFGRLDILINNASSFYPTPIGQVSQKDWQDLFSSNLKAPFFLTQAAVSELRKHKGVIVNMADIHGQNPLKEHPVYCAAKAGLIMLTRSLAKELAPDIRVNAIAPGSILWPEGAASLSELRKQEIMEQIALQRQGEPDDLAKALLYLTSDQSSYVTGQISQLMEGGHSRFIKAEK